MTGVRLRALLLAPPGAGKGTQGTRLAEAFAVEHLATGDLLRDHVARGTELGRAAHTYMERGELVPDQLVIDLILHRIGDLGVEDPEGFVLDGFPRTLDQATQAYEWAVERGRTFHAVVNLDVPDDELTRRLLERGRQAGRTDDNEETIAERLRVYAAQTAPLLHYYDGRAILVTVDGTGTVDEVADHITKALAERGFEPGLTG